MSRTTQLVTAEVLDIAIRLTLTSPSGFREAGLSEFLHSGIETVALDHACQRWFFFLFV
jgi:hypothetical protein